MTLAAETLQERLFLSLARAEDAVSRLDEQVRASPVAAGWRARLDFHEAAAWAWSSNLLAPLEDLVLHDAHMDVRAPGQDLGRAHDLVRARRKALQGGPHLLSIVGGLWLAGRSRVAPQESAAPPATATQAHDRGLLTWLGTRLEALGAGVTEGPAGGLGEWISLIDELQGAAPDLLTAAAALEGWRIISPLPREDYVGPILVAAWLQRQRRVASHLLGLQAGLRIAGPLPRRIAEGPPLGRIAHHLESLRHAALAGAEELRRLALTKTLLAHHLANRRRGSRAADLADLLLASPIVSAPMAAKQLGVSQQAVRALIPTLGSTVTELTGRRRFQAWRV